MRGTRKEKKDPSERRDAGRPEQTGPPANHISSGGDERRLREKQQEPRAGNQSVDDHQQRGLTVSHGPVEQRRTETGSVQNDHEHRHADVEPLVDLRRAETYRSLADAVADPGDASASAIVAQLVPAAEIH